MRSCQKPNIHFELKEEEREKGGGGGLRGDKRGVSQSHKTKISKSQSIHRSLVRRKQEYMNYDHKVELNTCLLINIGASF